MLPNYTDQDQPTVEEAGLNLDFDRFASGYNTIEEVTPNRISRGTVGSSEIWDREFDVWRL